jgi:hypothetical protein
MNRSMGVAYFETISVSPEWNLTRFVDGQVPYIFEIRQNWNFMSGLLVVTGRIWVVKHDGWNLNLIKKFENVSR